MKRLLVIGGTGFIGRHLCQAAMDAGYAVTALSLHPAAPAIPGARHLTADIGDIQALGASLAGLQFDYVVNCGGYIDHRSFSNGGRALIDGYVEGIQNLIECLDRTCLTRFVQLGSSDEYGNAPAPQSEDAREAPISPYSMARVAVTHLLQMLWRTEKFPAVVLRVFLTYGSGQGVERFVPQLIKGCLLNERFPVSAGVQLRDFCYIKDIVQGILAALEADNVCGELINLASGNPLSIRSLIETVQHIVGTGEPDFGKIPYRIGENMALYANVGKAASLLGWRPETSLMDGMQDTIAFYRDPFVEKATVGK